jgi:hypothetical protein
MKGDKGATVTKEVPGDDTHPSKSMKEMTQEEKDAAAAELKKKAEEKAAEGK